MDPVEKAKSEMGGMESFFTKIPGIAGYREKNKICAETPSKRLPCAGEAAGEPSTQADRAAGRTA